MRILWQDLRYGVRMLLKRPGFTAVVMLVLALGIGANSAIFSVVNAVLLRPLPYDDPDRIAIIWETNFNKGLDKAIVSPANFLDWRAQNTVFEQMSALRFWFYTLTGNGDPERIHGARVSASFFPLFGVQPVLGRSFLPEEEQVGHDRVVILSYGLWQRRYGADPNLIRETVMIDGEPFNVVGILPENFRFIRVLNRELDLWMPFAFDPAQLNREDHSIIAYGRLKRTVSLAEAQTEMDTMTRRLALAYPETNSGWGARVVRLQDQYTGSIRPVLFMLLGVVGFVLLIACANVANLLLARATARHKEIAIRTALGASRLRLLRQLLTESVLLALLSGALGLLLAFWGVDLLNALVPESAVARMDRFSIDPRVLGFTLVISLLSGVIFGLAPGIQASRTDLNESLKEGGKSLLSGQRGRRLRDLLVMSEMALAVMLLVGAGLMIRSSLRLQGIDRGIETNNLLTMQVSLPGAKYSTGQQITDFYQQALQRIGTTPGVESASAVNFTPFSGMADVINLKMEGQSSPLPGEEVSVPYRVIDHHYFRTMGIPLLSGRPFTPQDTETSPGAVLINETMARRFWPDENPLGKRLKPEFPASKAPWRPASNDSWLTVVGVVGDVKEDRLEDKTAPEMYLSYLQYPLPTMTLVARATSEPTGLATAMRNQVWAVDKDLPVYNIKTMEEVVSEWFAGGRVFTLLLGIFAALALCLAAVGIYSVMSYAVTQRTHEIGIRMALGAQGRDIFKLMVGQGMRVALSGVAIGLAASCALTRVMTSLLFGVSPTDPITFMSISLLLSVVALLACYIPARRAMKVDPMVALRYE